MASNSRVYVQSNRVAETKAFISDISRQFYDLGLRKERMVRDDMYVVSSSGSKLSWPKSKPYPHKPPKCSDCAPLFLKVATYGGAIKVQANSTSSASHESIVNYTVR